MWIEALVANAFFLCYTESGDKQAFMLSDGRNSQSYFLTQAFITIRLRFFISTYLFLEKTGGHMYGTNDPSRESE